MVYYKYSKGQNKVLKERIGTMMYRFDGTIYGEDDILALMQDSGADDDFLAWVDDNYTVSQILANSNGHVNDYVYGDLYDDYMSEFLTYGLKDYDIEVIEDEE